MMRSRRSWVLILALLIETVTLPSLAYAASEEKAPAGFSLPSFGSRDGENSLRRLEIISLGAFPIMLFYADFTFDMVRFLASGFDGGYAPWPFKSSSSFSPGDAERLARIGVALGASIGVGIADALIRERAQAKEEAEARAVESAMDAQSQAGPGVSAPSPAPSPSGNGGP
ncbi:MAG: hypothetical protein Q8M76_11345 [Spirochaetaceae bacterium]|nr:hypothetical protein [Spirochaetaceae bacterium]